MDARRTHKPNIPTTDEEIIDMIIRHEGTQYTNHPADRGGPTKYGITQRMLASFRGKPVTADDVRDMSRDEAAQVYMLRFIRPFRGMPVGILRANVIDMGVNAGIVRAAILLQQTVGADVDAIVGPQTIRMAEARDWNPFYVGTRIAFYERIIEARPDQIVWRNGWRSRALSFYGAAHRMLIRRDGGPAFHTGKAYL